MEVYIEYAMAENFCMDFTLFLAAKAACKNNASYFRLAAASILGACFAVVYPLINMPGYFLIALKIFSGLALCAVAGKFPSKRSYLKFSGCFFAVTFLTGGALIAIFSLTGTSYKSGAGYILSSVPVGIPLFFAAALAILIKKAASKFTNLKPFVATCNIYSGDKHISCKGFFDSGNKVYLGGSPVTVIPKHVAACLTDIPSINTFAKIHTVTGEGKLPVFKADKITIDDGKNVITRKGVLLGVSPGHIGKAVLHTDLMEGL